MNLCYVVNNDWGGGVYNAALETCRAAARHGHNATLLTLVTPMQWHSASDGVIRASLEAETSIDKDIPERFFNWIVEANPEVVLFGNVPAAEEAIPYLPSHIRCVYTVHDAAKVCWRNALRFEPNLNSIIVVSQYVANEFQSRLQVPNKVTSIHNGATFPLELKLNHFRTGDIMFIGSVNGLKGDADLPRLWPKLLERGFQGRLHCVGDCEDWVMQSLEALPQSNRIIKHGRIPREKTYEIAKTSMVSLALCRCDACPMAVIEAASMGCLIVTWDISNGITELVKDGKNGFFVPYCDFAQMADSVVKAIQNYSNLSQEAISYSRENYSLNKMWKGYEEHLNRVLSEPLITRSREGGKLPLYHAPRKYLALLPPWIRRPLVSLIRNSPTLHMLARNLRGI